MHLRRSSFLGLERLLLIALDHDHAQETAHDSTADKEEDDGNANGPDARREELLDWVRVVDEWLGWELVLVFCDRNRGSAIYHKQCPDGVVEEDGRSEDKHGESDEAIKLYMYMI